MSLALKLLPLLLLLQLHVNFSVSKSAESRLLYDLLRDYQSQTRPVRNHNTAINVTFGLAIISAQINKDGVLQMVAWERAFWTDELLRWNLSKYNNVSSLRIDESRIWIPDMTLFNKLQSTEKIRTQAVVSNDGSVLFIPQIRFYSQCMRSGSGMYSFNRYECTIKFGSWVYSALGVNVSLSEGNGIDLSEFISDGTWVVESSEGIVKVTNYACCPEPYQTAIFKFVLQRTSSLPYSTSAMIATALLLPFTFLLSRNQGVRVGTTIALLLGFTSSAALAQITIGKLGKGFDNYFCCSLVLMIICLLLHLLPRYGCKVMDRLLQNKGIDKNNDSGEALQEGSSSNSGSSSRKSKLNLILDVVFFAVSLIVALVLLLVLRSA